jgi:hypothetical protein
MTFLARGVASRVYPTHVAMQSVSSRRDPLTSRTYGVLGRLLLTIIFLPILTLYTGRIIPDKALIVCKHMHHILHGLDLPQGFQAFPFTAQKVLAPMISLKET